MPEHFTGLTGHRHELAERFGQEFWVITFNDETYMIIERNSEADDQKLTDFVDTQKYVAEWTLIKALSSEDAVANRWRAHDQWYAKENGVENWLWEGIMSNPSGDYYART